ncbi:hypothetical protein CER18_01170 [Bartonella tribocorum]|uniref:Uncharacterized protein n=1 Tax=Bartonella tribocorum TaxID=85701 RepID=A0A2M6UV50_9HYPH|nr:hypothetical protein CER18_01170 [Bartonella tribocorum]
MHSGTTRKASKQNNDIYTYPLKTEISTLFLEKEKIGQQTKILKELSPIFPLELKIIWLNS